MNLQDFLTNQAVGNIANLLLRVLIELIIFIVGVQMIKIVRKIIRKSMEKARAEKGVTQFVDSFVKASLYVVLIFFIASNLGMDAASIVALLGSAGVAIGLAIQGSLSNLAGGVLILILKPFKVGDYIIESSHKHEGTVEEIQIFYTKLRTPENHIVVLPNGSLANNSLVNVTATPDRRLDVVLQISYASDINLAKQTLLNVLNQEEKALKDKEISVFVMSLDDSGITLGVRCYVKNADYWDTKWSVSENCKKALDSAGVEIPFPQMDVHMK